MRCAVITPVGPGHERLVGECRESVAAAKRTDLGAFESVEHIVVDDTAAALGRSKARNDGVRKAHDEGFDWIFFLDADDLLMPGAFRSTRPFLADFDAIWGVIGELSPGENSPKMRFPQVMTLNSIKEILLHDPFLTLQMGHFARTSAALSVPFNEQLDAGEDFDYYLRIWERRKCLKIPDMLFQNRRGMHSQGARSANAAQWRETVERLVSEYRRRLGIFPDSMEGRNIVNNKTMEFVTFARRSRLITSENFMDLSSQMPYRGVWKVDCHAGPSILMLSDNDDMVVNSIIWTGAFEPFSLCVWTSLARRPGTVLDVGAYTGVYGMTAAASNPANSVFCFEPFDRNCQRILCNLEINTSIKMELVPAIVSEVEGERLLNVFPCGDLLTSKCTILEGQGTQPVRRDRIPSIMIDGFVRRRGIDRVSLVKIDVGGAETAALDGMRSTIDRDGPDLLVNVHVDQSGEWLANFFLQRGYRIFDVCEDSAELVERDSVTAAAGSGNMNKLFTRSRPDILVKDSGLKVR